MEEMVVKYVDTIGGRRVLTIARNSRLADEEKWIEGIGSEESFFEHWRPRPTDGSSSLQYLLHVVSDDGKTFVFQWENSRWEIPVHAFGGHEVVRIIRAGTCCTLTGKQGDRGEFHAFPQ